jgi:hypothetical protein
MANPAARAIPRDHGLRGIAHGGWGRETVGQSAMYMSRSLWGLL